MPQAERQEAVRETLAQVADMRTIGGHTTLAVPIDARSENFHVDTDGPAFIDLYPALVRKPDGSFSDNIKGPRVGNVFPWAMGTKSGTIIKILSSAIDRGQGVPHKLAHIARQTDDWCYDVLPENLPSDVRRSMERMVRLRFVPYLARIACHRAAGAVRC